MNMTPQEAAKAEAEWIEAARQARLRESWDAAAAAQQAKHPTLGGIDWAAAAARDKAYAAQRDEAARQQRWRDQCAKEPDLAKVLGSTAPAWWR